jgi:superfamily I DNA/RNA helicase
VTPEISSRRVESETPDAVALTTIHRSKGLEFQHVVAVGWAEGQLPHYNASSPEELAEEQRLAYVALSRAEQTLLITWSKGRNDPRFPDREPSRFLGPIDTVLGEIERQKAPVTGEQRRARLEAIRRELEANAPVVVETPTVLGR